MNQGCVTTLAQVILVTGCNPNDLDIWTDWCRHRKWPIENRSCAGLWTITKVISPSSRWQCTHSQNLWPSHNSLLSQMIWIFHTIVVHEPRLWNFCVVVLLLFFILQNNYVYTCVMAAMPPTADFGLFITYLAKKIHLFLFISSTLLIPSPLATSHFGIILAFNSLF